MYVSVQRQVTYKCVDTSRKLNLAVGETANQATLDGRKVGQLDGRIGQCFNDSIAIVNRVIGKYQDATAGRPHRAVVDRSKAINIQSRTTINCQRLVHNIGINHCVSTELHSQRVGT